MPRNRRKSLIRIVEIVAVGVVTLDAVLYFVVLQPVRNLTQEKFERSNQVRLQIRNEESRVNRLEWYKAAIPATQQDVDDFLSNEVQPKRKSFSRSSRLLRGLAQDAGIDLAPNGISYRMDSLRDAPLDRMNLIVTVKGSFQGLLNFSHALETTSDDFIVLHDFAFDSKEGSNLTLHLSADLYLTP